MKLQLESFIEIKNCVLIFFKTLTALLGILLYGQVIMVMPNFLGNVEEWSDEVTRTVKHQAIFFLTIFWRKLF